MFNTIPAVLRKAPISLLWIAFAFLALLLSHNAILYFTHGGEYGILPEKLDARKDFLWNASFYIHLPAGVICLLIPFFSFAIRLGRLASRYHAAVGKIYVWTTLTIVCPTGMYLALYAKGGIITMVGFLLQAVLLGYYTWKGLMAIRSWDLPAHAENMIRSYSVASVVITFRVLHLLFFFLQLPYYHNYAISQWLGLAVNLLAAEIVIGIRSQKHSSLKTLTI